MVANLKKILKIVLFLLIVFSIVWVCEIEIFFCEIPIVSDGVSLLSSVFFSILTIYFLALALRIKKRLLKYFVVILTTFLILFVHMLILIKFTIYQFEQPYTVLEVSGGNFDKEIVVIEQHIVLFTHGRLYSKIAPGIWKYEDCFLEGEMLCPISNGNYTAWYDNIEERLCIKAQFWYREEEEVKRFRIP